jgi:hypothetical protein
MATDILTGIVDQGPGRQDIIGGQDWSGAAKSVAGAAGVAADLVQEGMTTKLKGDLQAEQDSFLNQQTATRRWLAH